MVKCERCHSVVEKCDVCGELFYPDEDMYCVDGGEKHCCTLDCVLETTDSQRTYGRKI